MRWDRVGRVALVIVLVVVAFLYLQHAITYFGARSSYTAQERIVRQLERSNARLAQQQKQLHDPATIVQNARQLGMVRPGERSFAVNGLPDH